MVSAWDDESSILEGLTGSLQFQCDTAREIVAALRNGESAGRAFEILRPLSRQSGMRPTLQLLTVFANMAIRQLIDADGASLLAWFERIAESEPIPLHRP
jgi:hypothetical protein